MWHAPLNLTKCHSMYIGRAINRIDPIYLINGTPISSVTSIKNLGVILESDLSWSPHVQSTASDSMFLLRQIQRAFPSPSPTTVGTLYKSLIRPKIEYANIAWQTSTEFDTKIIENVQRKATKWGSLRHRSYDSRLSTLRLTSLKDRSLRQDCIQLFKHFKNIQPLRFVHPPHIHQRVNRGHHLKYSGESASNTTYPPRYSFLTNRAAARWNSLPQVVANCTTVAEFKTQYDRYVGSNV